MQGFYIQMKYETSECRDKNGAVVSPSRWMYWYYNPGETIKFTHFNSAKSYARRKIAEKLIPGLLEDHLVEKGYTLAVVDAATAQTQT